jgi:DNA-binding IclR family transcriptional regulator
VRYEDLVVDLAGQTRRIVQHCGLEWDSRCLDFHATERPVRTASATQVRQPIYRSAIGRAQPYAGYLEPLLRALTAKDHAESTGRIEPAVSVTSLPNESPARSSPASPAFRYG